MNPSNQSQHNNGPDIPDFKLALSLSPPMITDSQLYSLAIFLGSAAMMLIVLYHFLEVNSEDHKVQEKPNSAAGKSKAKA
ncbi:Ost4 domain containing protein [Pyrenophora tritici-repentis]|uniref:Dolichyl-diphosphooligosaccharide--protein glycosyltransferase subunit 4 n=2 Tax=Pyrenophora tritici-repentis TaxID=45151 RepID=B2VQQ8_PYRTR|nr:uncharacterized protein PTRG_00526 [Pyrenophora tritici-repentis Pt-1C-BFP]KAA8625132.1 Ost4 domain-containing protein [Pyrenophora tritici-repentis]EDU39964.1 hypothetical protein PTRG_00526 [Pyrenophora tritici-repentis Pt-1C-BFP]KAF7453529.1 Ost4 domain containing protein [Pyrenophora tritici-repentis]KAG9387282.1 Ost4 domain containing protein [Pyrenophora tritici-repentis]KAI0587416.1 Ost4 domain-containing protein [Pyrenophora tritici-repentis]